MRILTGRMELIPYTEAQMRHAILDPSAAAAGIGAALAPLSSEAFFRAREAYAARLYLMRRYPEDWHFSAMWQMVMQETRVIAGELGFKGPPVRGELEIGYLTHEGYRGMGLMTEAVLALLSHMFFEYPERVRFISAATRKGNFASIRVLKKCGFRKEEDRFQYVLFRKYRED